LKWRRRQVEEILQGTSMKGKETFDRNRPIVVMVGSATKTGKEKSGAASKEGYEGGKSGWISDLLQGRKSLKHQPLQNALHG
jgi:hypothetical protein